MGTRGCRGHVGMENEELRMKNGMMKQRSAQANEELRYSMKKKSAVICLICVICVPWLLASCVKDELHNTPHPDQGVVSVSVDYPQGAEEDDYTVEVDGKPLDEGDNASKRFIQGQRL